MSNSSVEIHFAPLQGFTDKTYRNVFEKHFEGVDFYYTPFIQLENDGTIKKQKFADIDIELKNKLIPQVLAGTIDEFNHLIDKISSEGYNTINLNIGCPFPMVVNKGRGAGLLSESTQVSEILQNAIIPPGVELTLKMRTGIFSNSEVYDIIPHINPAIISKIILHPRYAKQMYKGFADFNTFLSCVQKFPAFDWIYNGDITSIDDLTNLKKLLPNQQKWMIGRGILMNPFLPQQIKTGLTLKKNEKEFILRSFFFDLIDQTVASSNDAKHAHNRMTQYAIYFTHVFENQHKALKLLSKTHTIEQFKVVLSILFSGKFEIKM